MALPEKQHKDSVISVPEVVVGGVLIIAAFFVVQAVVGFLIGLIKLAIVVGVIALVAAFVFRNRD